MLALALKADMEGYRLFPPYRRDRTISLTFSVSPTFNPTIPKRSLSTTPSKCNAHHAVKCTPTGSQSTVMYETWISPLEAGFPTLPQLTPLSLGNERAARQPWRSQLCVEVPELQGKIHLQSHFVLDVHSTDQVQQQHRDNTAQPSSKAPNRTLSRSPRKP